MINQQLTMNRFNIIPIVLYEKFMCIYIEKDDTKTKKRKIDEY